MSAFGEHGETTKFSVAPDDFYICDFKELKVTEGPSFDDPTVMEKQFLWTWETSDVVDEDDKPYRFIKYTGVRYGGDRANLTKLLDSMLGKRLEDDEFRALDPEEFKKTKWRLGIELTTNKKGKPINIINSVKPATEPKAKVASGGPRPKTLGEAVKKAASVPNSAEAEDEGDGMGDPFAE